MSETAPAEALFGSGSGQGRLVFEKVGSRTQLRHRQASSPLKWLAPRAVGPVAWAVSSHYGGGMVAGDKVGLQIALEPGAAALVTTQAPGKVFGGEPGVTQSIEARVEAGAALAWLPDPLVCFAGAAFAQTQEVALAPGASLLWAESLGCGRGLRGERWAFARYESRLRVRRDGRLILNEAQRLQQDAQGLAARFGPYAAQTSVFLCGPAFAAAAAGLLKALAEAPLKSENGVIESGGRWQEDGALLRLAAVSPEALQQALQRRLHFVTEWLGQDPWHRRML